MLVKPSHLVLTATLILSAATSSIAHPRSRQNDLERRSYDILQAYQHSARGFGAFDDEDLDARDSSDFERREELVSELAARFRNVLNKRSPLIDTHGYGHAWREQQSLQKRSIFPHDDSVISSIRSRLKNRRAEQNARKAKAAKARQDALEEIERREVLEGLVLAARELADEEELSAREYEDGELFDREPELDEDEYLAARELVEAGELLIRDEEIENTIQQARSWLGEQEEAEARELEPSSDAREFLEKLIHNSRELAEEGRFTARDMDDDLEGLLARTLAEDEELLSREFLHDEELDIRGLEKLLMNARNLVDEEELAVRTVAEEELDARELEDLLVEARDLAEEEALAARELVEGHLEVRGPTENIAETREILSDNQVKAREESVPNVVEAREPVAEESLPEARDILGADDTTKREVEPDVQLEAREPKSTPAEAPAARELEEPFPVKAREPSPAVEEPALVEARAPEPTPAEALSARELEEPLPVEAREPSSAAEEPAPVEARAPEVGDILVERSPDAEPASPLAARTPEPTPASD